MLRICNKYNVYHPSSKNTKSYFVEDVDIVNYLCSKVSFDKTLRFEKLFNLCILHKELFNVIFNVGCLYGNKIDHYIEEFNQPFLNKIDLDYLSVYWYTNESCYDGINEIQIVPSFHGIKRNYVSNCIIEPCDMNIAIEYSPLYELKGLNIKLENDIHFSKIEGNNVFTLFDVFYAILFEISYHGTPAKRNATLDRLYNL